MNNDRSPAWKMEKVVTINSEFSLCGLIIIQYGIEHDAPEFVCLA